MSRRCTVKFSSVTFSADEDYLLVLRTQKIRIDPRRYYGIWNAKAQQDHLRRHTVPWTCRENLLEVCVDPDEEKKIQIEVKDQEATPRHASHHLAWISESHWERLTSKGPFRYESYKITDTKYIGGRWEWINDLLGNRLYKICHMKHSYSISTTYPN